MLMNIKIKNYLDGTTGQRVRIVVVALCLVFTIFLLWPGIDSGIGGGESLRVYSEENFMLREFSSAENGAYGIWLKLNEFPDFIRNSVVETEDRRFYYHPGFDPVAIVRSLRQNVSAGRIVSGGSTITQQLVRIVYTDALPRNPYLKKIVEIVLALKLEARYSKDGILEAYLNRVPMKFNQNGLPAASRRIFGRDIRFISQAEAIALVVLIRENQASREIFRRRYISLLGKTADAGSQDLDSVEDKVFSREAYSYTDKASPTMHFEEFIRSIQKDASGDIHTSLRGNLNEEIKRIISSERMFLQPYMAENCSVIVLKLPENGEEKTKLVAMVGSENFNDADSGQVNGCLSVRQAGSSLKPFIYGYAMDNLGYTPYSIVNDTPLSFGVNSNETYVPKNNDLRYWGPVTVREALACSRNIPAVYMVRRIGIADFYLFLKNAGFNHMYREPEYYGPGIALGTGGASLIQLCRAYSALACHGVELPLYIGTGRIGDILLGERKVLFSEKTSFRVTHILSDNSARRRAFGNRNFLDFPFDVAVKTGTSKDFRDAWTVGYTEKYLVGVWVGNFSGKQMNSVTGGWGAGRIFHQVIRLVTGRDKPVFRLPDNVRMVRFCRATGLVAGTGCSYWMEPVFVDDKLPVSCTSCRGGLARTDYFSQGTIPEILSPGDGESFIIDPSMPIGGQQISLKIFFSGFSGSGEKYSYAIDSNKPVLIRGTIERVLQPVRGVHTIRVFMDGKVVDSSSFTVE